ncbi:P-loop containing nucleoside triphosphate hydrolase protein [Annulohypoxylon maeteangense]|uniref:P-loop containing nucleoside triphosphate hydrolase protein n=1 Tax=Annulohypoxylon maeteangense TaxID=1927788 RepID=UPI0020078893|nr:P-loop containing nucleoside triphosphate hydrolase protein [Annulohypoxylon maeteangense]KAI0884882.1 P-loop containing nucleoside triphosphate hydrolase protein [Annulohypoxylon maeteangense]
MGSVLIRRKTPLLLSPALRIHHRQLSTSTILRAPSRRIPELNSGFTSSYDPNEEGRGPMFSKSTFGVPQFYPRDLKKRVDEYVVGQDRAKKSISSVIFNHYQNVRRRKYQEEQERKREEKLMRQAIARDRNARDMEETHPVEGWPHPTPMSQRYRADDFDEDEFPGHNDSIQQMHQAWQHSEQKSDFYIPEDTSRTPPVKIDKSNLLLLGPTGVGKTYILETLSKKINVPFTICDCNSFTQAGYIGQDVETCIERLLIESNYDVRATEHGIVVLDEFDKIAKRETMNGRDVGGEGVQQALLKLVEGTKISINVKDNRTSSSSRSATPITTSYTGPGSSTSTSGPQPTPPPIGKVDQYTIDTSNILFVMCGAFVGLDKVILNRVSKSSMGFGSEIRSRSTSGNKPDLPPALFTHIPHRPLDAEDTSSLTALDLATPEDLQGFGFIPELIGRVHNIVALSPLSRTDLLRILTEPRNSLVAQYTALFQTYPSNLFFTQKALQAIAERAEKAKTGARGLKMEMERVLAEAMFDAPTHFVLVTEKAVRGEEKVGYWGKDGRLEIERLIREEDGLAEVTGQDEHGREIVSSLGQYREAGESGA